jgi:hypothetical protein
MTYRARLLDLEGRVVYEIDIPNIRRTIEVCVAKPQPITWCLEELDFMAPAMRVDNIRFELERVAGDGVLIYRRITPLWNYPKRY